MSKKLTLLFITFTLILASCGATKTTVAADPYIGTWDLIIKDTPQGDVYGTMVISKDAEGVYAGTLSSDVGDMSLENVVIDNSELVTSFIVQDMDFVLKGTFTGTDFTGNVDGMGELFPTTGKKKVTEN